MKVTSNKGYVRIAGVDYSPFEAASIARRISVAIQEAEEARRVAAEETRRPGNGTIVQGLSTTVRRIRIGDGPRGEGRWMVLDNNGGGVGIAKYGTQPGGDAWHMGPAFRVLHFEPRG